MSFEQNKSDLTSDPEAYTGRGQSDWAGSDVVIYRKEDKGRKQNSQTNMPAGLPNMDDGTDD